MIDHYELICVPKQKRRFVLAPQYTNQATDAANTLALLDYVVENYNVDADRLYTTGQSAGNIKSIQFILISSCSERPTGRLDCYTLFLAVYQFTTFLEIGVDF